VVVVVVPAVTAAIELIALIAPCLVDIWLGYRKLLALSAGGGDE
jgi:hypothetical protein